MSFSSKAISVFFSLATCLALAFAAPAVRAQADDDPGDLVAPARLSVAEGSVSFWRPGEGDWAPAQVNMPLTTGDSILAGERATVEIQVGPRSFVRLMANSQINFIRNDAGLVEVQLASGNASFDLHGMLRNQAVQIDTPNASFAADGNGYYRVDVREGTTRFVVRRSGRATLGLADGYSRAAVPGEQIIVRGVTATTVEVATVPPPDSWDRWNDARTAYYDKAVANRYLPPDVYGAADLDSNGTWQEVPEYGPVWLPTVATGWTPFSAGYWRWDPVYEWTWVDQAPWGWAPSHYGRWVFVTGRWAWAPGLRGVRPAYAPAVVAFLGIGSGPQVGWVALGWGEPIVPWWGHRGMRGRAWWGGWGGPRIVNNVVVERTTTINVNAITYRNTHVQRAVIAVPEAEFGGHRARPDHDRRFRAVAPDEGRFTPRLAPPTASVERRSMPRGDQPSAPIQRIAPMSAPTVAQPAPAPLPAPVPAPGHVRVESRPSAGVSEPAPVLVPAPQTVMRSASPPEVVPRQMEQYRGFDRRENPSRRDVQVIERTQRQEIPVMRPAPMQSAPMQSVPAPAPAPSFGSRPMMQSQPAPVRAMRSESSQQRSAPQESQGPSRHRRDDQDEPRKGHPDRPPR